MMTVGTLVFNFRKIIALPKVFHIGVTYRLNFREKQKSFATRPQSMRDLLHLGYKK